MSKVFFEQYFTYDGLTEKEGDYLLNILIHSNELENSEIVSAYLRKLSEKEMFFSVISSKNNVNKTMSGKINFNKRSIYLLAKVDVLGENQNSYEVYNKFKILMENIKRTTIIETSKTIYEDILPLFNHFDVEELKSKVNKSF